MYHIIFHIIQEKDDKDLIKTDIEKGDLVVVKFSGKKSTQFFIANVISELEREEGDGDFIIRGRSQIVMMILFGLLK